MWNAGRPSSRAMSVAVRRPSTRSRIACRRTQAWAARAGRIRVSGAVSVDGSGQIRFSSERRRIVSRSSAETGTGRTAPIQCQAPYRKCPGALLGASAK